MRLQMQMSAIDNLSRIMYLYIFVTYDQLHTTSSMCFRKFKRIRTFLKKERGKYFFFQIDFMQLIFRFYYHENRLSFYVTYDIRSSIIAFFMNRNLGNRIHSCWQQNFKKTYTTTHTHSFPKMKNNETIFLFFKFQIPKFY